MSNAGYIAGVLALVVVSGIIYNVLWGRDRRLLRSRAYCYRDLHVPSVSDSEFSNSEYFEGTPVPKRYLVAKRFELGDYYLDFPPDRLDADMRWEDVPLDPSPWCRELDDLFGYIKKNFAIGEPEKFLKGKTIGEIIQSFYEFERNICWNDARVKPPGWEHTGAIRELNKRIGTGQLPQNYLDKATIADILPNLYEWRTKKS